MINKILSHNKVIYPAIKQVNLLPNEISLSIHNLPWFSYLKSPMNNDSSDYSIIGLSPAIVIKSISNNLEIKYYNKSFSEQGNIFNLLKKILNSFIIHELPIDIPFFAGGIGYLSYDLVNYIEQIQLPEHNILNIPESIWIFYDLVYIFCHQTGEAYLSCIDLTTESSKASIKKLNEKIKYWENLLIENISKSINTKIDLKLTKNIKSNISKIEYINAVNKIKNHIINGDIYQANFTYQYQIPFWDSSFNLFHIISEYHPTPFSAYINLDNFQVLSFSPERFVKCINNNILVQPMKGTRPRGKNILEDEKNKLDLLNSPKDNAELVMIVDLLRNDLGKVSNFASINVDKIKNIETYPSVYQLTSSISAQLCHDKTLIDLIIALFPSGSITGCPKISAMKIISSLEKHKRSIFMGNIGYISFHNTLDLNVAIRTIVRKDDMLYFQVGSGIIHDSIPEDEFQETLHKSNFLFNFIDDKNNLNIN
ncbi:MAG: anthranilate synthase component I family protein [Spirochaetota bacterium]|nr:anthranilate synthase component I family protein [Spirochaetota bacterium]